MSSKSVLKEVIKDKELQNEVFKVKFEKEHKEHKDKREKEHKEKDKFEKETKEEADKSLKEKDKDFEKDLDKDAEFRTAGGPVVAEAAMHKFHHKEILEKTHKDFEKVQKDKEIETAAQAAAIHKFHHKEVLEKTHKDFEKVQKDKEIETAAQAAVQPQALRKIIEKTHKDFEKVHKDFKELKEFKFEKIEKFEIKEKDWDVAGPAHVGPGDPVEQRLAVLEATVAQLMHFIPAELRPDLSTGALAQEPAKPQAGKAAPGAAAEGEKEQADKDKGKK